MKYLTITVPCYNSEKYLRRCLDSLTAGGNDVEVIVVNDGSADRTGEIAESYAGRFPEIVTVVHWYYVKKKYKLNVDFFVELIPSYFSGFSYHVFQIF